MENPDDSNFTGELERRGKRRFPIKLEVKYKMLYGQGIAETGTGQTLNLSSAGVWFSTENELTCGVPVELSVSWPILLHDSCPIKLVVYGSVVRSNERGAAMAIERYEFRTSGARAYQQPAVPASVEYRQPN
ncbi:MAG TPA: hypothetical protein VKJ01_21870 [Candidatus Solibacter sp.]|jgi:hypothetical protein|nr:hypothetical protein [Candidatus Solibacter sp.]